MRQRFPAKTALLAALLSLSGCKGQAQSLCAQDQQCAPGFSCDPSTGRCACDTDSSCGEGDSCNQAGFCQPRLRCDSSADCQLGSYCDSKSGACIPSGTCTQDVQCPAGQVCEQFSCVGGCRQSGDCHLAEVCRACAQGTPAAQCPVGKQCVRGRCDRQTSCRYGELCLPPPGADPATDCTAETSDCTCVKDTRGPFCGGCSSAPATPSLCGGAPESYCLIDSTKPLGQAFFCGVNCAEGQECPNGYACRDVRIVTAQTCKFADALSACPPPAGKIPAPTPCDPAKTHAASGKPGLVNDDCLAAAPPLVGAVCDPVTRVCSAQCLGTGETSSYGFCSCLQDSDCPQDHCSASTYTCSISGKPCQVNISPDECQTTHQIRCVKALDARLGDVGYCRIGQNCAPAAGYTCEVLRSGGP